MDISSGAPFDDIRALLRTMPGPDDAAARSAADRSDGAFGSFERLVGWAASWQRRATPTADRALVCLYASAHGAGAPGGSAATRARIEAYGAGTATINVLCAASGLGFKAFDLALDLPSGDIRREPALGERDCVATMAFGMEAASGADLLGLGHVGGDAPTAALAVLAALHGGSDRGDATVAAALRRHGADLSDPLAVDPLGTLASLGGRDLAALAGAIVAARQERVPVVLDGMPALAAASVLQAVDPRALDHCVVAERPEDAVGRALVERTGLPTILGPAAIPGGEGIGAALALGLLKTVFAAHRDRRPAPGAA